jgi:hypothetical protein
MTGVNCRCLYTDECLVETCICVISVLASNHAPVAQEFLKRGCPRGLRGRIWAQIMGSYIHPEHEEYFSGLKQVVLDYDLMVDKLIIKVRIKVEINLSMCLTK